MTDSKTLPTWMLKAIGNPENAQGRILVLLDDPEKKKEAEQIIFDALTEKGVKFELRGNF